MQPENRCILCGKCLSVCPLLAATGREELAPRAKGWLARHLRQSPGELAEVDAARLADFCLGCGRCQEVCPQGVDVPALVAGLRAEHPTFRHKLWKTWLNKARTLWPLARKTAKALPEQLTPGRLGLALKGLRGLGTVEGPGSTMAPLARVEQYTDEFQGTEALLFPGCAGSYLAPRWERTARRLVRGLGMDRIDLGKNASFACCGSPLAAAGFGTEARQARTRNIEIWRSAGRPMLLTYCASCLRGLLAYPDEDFVDPPEAQAWRDAIRSLSSRLLSCDFVVLTNAPGEGRVGYHRPCHMEGADTDQALLWAALGPRLRPLPDVCCGFGGVMRLTAPALADKVAATRARDLKDLDLVVTGCTACVTQLAALATCRVAHWLDILQPEV